MKSNILIMGVFIICLSAILYYLSNFNKFEKEKKKETPDVSTQYLDNYDYLNIESLKKLDCLTDDHTHKAAARGYVFYVKKCLELGLSPNIKERAGWTPLHSASRHGYLTIVKLLIQNGADVNISDVTGRTPLDQAIISGNKELITYLDSLDVNK